MPREVVWDVDANVGSGSTQSAGAGQDARTGIRTRASGQMSER
jgi:hypothetical protein